MECDRSAIWSGPESVPLFCTAHQHTLAPCLVMQRTAMKRLLPMRRNGPRRVPALCYCRRPSPRRRVQDEDWHGSRGNCDGKTLTAATLSLAPTAAKVAAIHKYCSQEHHQTRAGRSRRRPVDNVCVSASRGSHCSALPHLFTEHPRSHACWSDRGGAAEKCRLLRRSRASSRTIKDPSL